MIRILYKLEIRRECPYCSNKLVDWIDPQTGEKYKKCDNCGYKVQYSEPETTDQ